MCCPEAGLAHNLLPIQRQVRRMVPWQELVEFDAGFPGRSARMPAHWRYTPARAAGSPHGSRKAPCQSDLPSRSALQPARLRPLCTALPTLVSIEPAGSAGLPSRSARQRRPPSPVGLRRGSLRLLAPREGWWARQDSNLEPDGYEPSALTIELRAPLALRRNGCLITEFAGPREPGKK
jgi:hypothetical protein